MLKLAFGNELLFHAVKDKAMQYHNVEFRKPEYHLYDGIKQHPDYLEGVNYEAPATFLVRLCEVDRR